MIRERKAPYADFAIWGKADSAKIKAAKMRGVRPMPDGSWVQVEVTGPGSLEAWRECHKVFKTAAIMLNILTPETCDGYMD